MTCYSLQPIRLTYVYVYTIRSSRPTANICIKSSLVEKQHAKICVDSRNNVGHSPPPSYPPPLGLPDLTIYLSIHLSIYPSTDCIAPCSRNVPPKGERYIEEKVHIAPWRHHQYRRSNIHISTVAHQHHVTTQAEESSPGRFRDIVSYELTLPFIHH